MLCLARVSGDGACRALGMRALEGHLAAGLGIFGSAATNLTLLNCRFNCEMRKKFQGDFECLRIEIEIYDSSEKTFFAGDLLTMQILLCSSLQDRDKQL